MNPEKVSIYAVGDVIPDRPNPESLFELALPTLKEADILFGQLEAPLTEKGEPQLQAFPEGEPQLQAFPRGCGRWLIPEWVSGLTYAGFDVMSFASNHTLDRSEEGLFATIDTLTKNNIAVIGVGKNIDEARKPLILERKGTKVAFLAYGSVLPKGYEARADKSGCAPIRAFTSYEQVDWQPGTPPRVLTFANKGDLTAMVDDIKKVRPLAEVVIMSIHWGVHNVPGMIAMYQKEIGYAAIDAGVDLILGHHGHILKGIEVYKGKVIFYDLANFVVPTKPSGWRSPVKAMYGIKVDTEYPDYDMPVDSRKSMIAKCIISDKKIERVSYFPVMINGHAQPEVLSRSDKRSSEVFEYMNWCCNNQGLDSKFSWEGDEVVIRTTGLKSGSNR
ncbi:MAG: CapA family protein [Deltaproteobacteria bacterium]|nr:CapA family protein [Deltaproteobacteria bacterium]